MPTDLDDAYANAAHIPRADIYPAKWAAEAAAFRDTMLAAGRARLDQPYGAAPRERYDLFLPEGTPKGLGVFVHGGYWKAFGREDWSHLAAGAVARGWAMALPSYTLCPMARISHITGQMVQAVTHAARAIPGPLRICGHSAGGHLSARLACKGVLPDALIPRLARVLPISPLADLHPLMRTTMNEVLHIDEDEARAESPALHPPVDAPVTVWVGAEERPAFVEQAHLLGDAWHCAVVEAPGQHHFNVIEPLADPDGAITQALLA